MNQAAQKVGFSKATKAGNKTDDEQKYTNF